MSDARTISIIVNAGAVATSNKTSAKLLDSGNLILMDGQKTIWQSFDYPTDTFLPGMNLGWFNIDTDYPRTLYLSSWLSPSDPNRGFYYLGLDASDRTKFNVWHKGRAYQHIGFWDGHVFRFFFQSSLDNHQNFSFVSNSKDIYLTLNSRESNIISWFVLASDGSINEFRMVGQDISSVNYSLCDTMLPHNSTGCWLFKPSICKDGDNFSDIKGLIPNSMVVTWEGHMGPRDCELTCKSNCSCVAYASFDDDGTGCELLSGHKADLLNNKGRGNKTIHIRSDASNSDNEKKRKIVTIIIVLLIPLILMISIKFLFCLWVKFNCSGINRSQVGTREVHTSLTSQISTNNDDPSGANLIELSRKNDHELPRLSFSSVVKATDNFSVLNKLGEGGYGPVYKGKLQGYEIAVKRLSKNSGQGMAEFKSEVELISKLQHRNLVKLLGCCIEREEKILIYEYMPNRSLDSFIFDPVKQQLLDWRKRKHIIKGIAQGLLYLHKYSRLRIIHRDLKTSNILLDDYMNPKISDFGMARIVLDNKSRNETKRVAGSFGYMSPEYAVHGHYSTKSDVFSFGVILLEILSGRKNATFCEPDCSLDLLGYAWELWNDGRCMELMDPTLDGLCPENDMMVCIQLGLLCVQESAGNRPSMSEVVSIFSNERASLAMPKHSAYSTLLSAADCSISTKQTP
ncbi:G-type lectin S-receptor-like serine/threonine-protein kinase CES101 isoform X2 [Ziziphus jujuba]|nr:G-type lectin S-receptor-like serine/threonine-protein kinase CES101 isoform X2 [Ziziphus jujuba]